MLLEEKLVDICKNFIQKDDLSVVIQEPYIPYIPVNWNKILVLAESQNLSKNHEEYLNLLSAISSEQRIKRLGIKKEYVGVYPWDDGSIKLALEAAMVDVNSSEVAVSNAVLWSQIGDNRKNVTPASNLHDISAKVWTEILSHMQPETIICCGKIAQNVIRKSNWKGATINLRLPSKNAMSRVSGMFDSDDLLERFPEVKKVLEEKPDLIGSAYRKNKIFYACHAVSLILKK